MTPKQHAMIQDVRQMKQNVNKDEWPSIRRVVDPSASKADQEKQLEEWVTQVFNAYT